MSRKCPADRHLLGGSAQTNSFDNGQLLGTLPFDGSDPGASPDDYWVAAMAWDGSATESGQVEAVCTTRAVSYSSSSQRSIGGGGSGTATARCPAETQVAGGGGAARVFSGFENGTYLSSSYPFDGGDSDRNPDDGWKVRAYNAFDGPATVEAYAFCSTLDLLYVNLVFASPPTTPLAAGDRVTSLPCPATHHLVSGGVRLESAAEGRAIGLEGVDDLGDGDFIRDDFIEISTRTEVTMDATFSLICKD